MLLLVYLLPRSWPNICVRQNASDFALEYPLAAKAVEDSFYMDDGLTGADSSEEAIKLYQQLQSLFEKGGFCSGNGVRAKPQSSITQILVSVTNTLFTPSQMLMSTQGPWEWNGIQDMTIFVWKSRHFHHRS